MVPVAQIPKTINGKTQINGKMHRYMLRDNFLKRKYDDLLARVNGGIDSIRVELKALTQKQIENEIILIIERVTESNEDVNIHTSFLDLGISSIQMIQIKVALESRFMGKLGDIAVFRHSSVKGLTSYIYRSVLNNEISIPTKKVDQIDLTSAETRMRSMLQA